MYSFGVFVEEIRGMQLAARRPAVVFRLADYPSLVVRPDPGAKILPDVTPAGTVPIRAGKSCLFHCPPAVSPPRTLQLLLIDLLEPDSAADESHPSPASLAGKGLLLARASIELEPCLSTQWYSPVKVKMVDLAGNLVATLVGHTRLARQDTALTPHLLSVGPPHVSQQRSASASAERVPAPPSNVAAGLLRTSNRQPPAAVPAAHVAALPVDSKPGVSIVPDAEDVTSKAVRALTALAAALPALAAGGAAAFAQTAPATTGREPHASMFAPAAATPPAATLPARAPPPPEVTRSTTDEGPRSESDAWPSEPTDAWPRPTSDAGPRSNTDGVPRLTSDAGVQSDVCGDVYSSLRGDIYRYAEDSWRPLPSDAHVSQGAPGAKNGLRSAQGTEPFWAREPPHAPKAEPILIEGVEDQGAPPPGEGGAEYVHPRLRSVRAPPGLFFHHDPAALAAAQASEAARTAAHLTAAAVASAAGGLPPSVSCAGGGLPPSVSCAGRGYHSAAAPRAFAHPPPEARSAAAAAAAAVQVAAAAVDAAAVNAVAEAEAVRRKWRIDPATAAAGIVATLPLPEASGGRPPAGNEPAGGILNGILSGLGGTGGASFSGGEGGPGGYQSVLQGLGSACGAGGVGVAGGMGCHGSVLQGLRNTCGAGGVGMAGGMGGHGSVLQGLVSDLEYVQSPQYALEMVRASLLRQSGTQQQAPFKPGLGATGQARALYTARRGGGDASFSRTAPSADAVELLSATVPAGVGPGDYIRLVTPAGRTVEVLVPPHATAGDMFHFVAEAGAGAPPPGDGRYDTSSVTAQRFATAGEAAASAAKQLLASVRGSVGDSTFGDTATGWAQPASQGAVRDYRPVWGVGPGGRSRQRTVGRSSREPLLSDAALLGLWGGPAVADVGATRYAPSARPSGQRGGCAFAAGGIGGLGSTGGGLYSTTDGFGSKDGARRSHVLAGGAARVHQDSVASANQLAPGTSAQACIASIEAERRSLLEEMRGVRASLRGPAHSHCTVGARDASPGSRSAAGCSTTSPVADRSGAALRFASGNAATAARSGRSPASARGAPARASASAGSLPSSQLWPAQKASERRLVAILQASFQKLDPTGRGCVPIGRLIRALETAGATDAASTPDARAWSTRLRSLCLLLEARLHAAASLPGGDDMEFLIFWEDALALATKGAKQGEASEAGAAGGRTGRSVDGGLMACAADKAQAAAEDAGYTPPSAISQAAARFVAANAPQMPERGARIECAGGGPPASLMAAAAAERAAAATGARVSRAMRESGGAGNDRARAAACCGGQREGDTTHLVVALETDSGPGGVAIPAEMLVPGNIRALSRTQYAPEAVPRLMPTVVATTDAAAVLPLERGEAHADVSTLQGVPRLVPPVVATRDAAAVFARERGATHADASTVPRDAAPALAPCEASGPPTESHAAEPGREIERPSMVALGAQALDATPESDFVPLGKQPHAGSSATTSATMATPLPTLPVPHTAPGPPLPAEAPSTLRSQPTTSASAAVALHASAVAAAPRAVTGTAEASAALRIQPATLSAAATALHATAVAAAPGAVIGMAEAPSSLRSQPTTSVTAATASHAAPGAVIGTTEASAALRIQPTASATPAAASHSVAAPPAAVTGVSEASAAVEQVHSVVAPPAAVMGLSEASAAVERVRLVSWAAPSADLCTMSDLDSPTLELSRSHSLLDSGYLSHSLLDSACLGHGSSSGSVTPYSLSESCDSQPGRGRRRAASPPPGAMGARHIASGECCSDVPSASAAGASPASSSYEAPLVKASAATQQTVAHPTSSSRCEAVETVPAPAAPESTASVAVVMAATSVSNAPTRLLASSIAASPTAAIAATSASHAATPFPASSIVAGPQSSIATRPAAVIATASAFNATTPLPASNIIATPAAAIAATSASATSLPMSTVVATPAAAIARPATAVAAAQPATAAAAAGSAAVGVVRVVATRPVIATATAMRVVKKEDRKDS